jgi:hypothetical protein
MADTKISALPASTVPLAGTEVLPIVQSSTTKQVSIANLTAGRSFDALGMTLTSTDAGATAAPLLELYRDSATPAASDTLGEIEFNGEDSAGNKQAYGLIHASILSPTSTAEQGQIHFETATAGALTEKMIIGTTNLVINEIGAVFNVRIEGDTDANLFCTDATNSRVGVGTVGPTAKLDVVGGDIRIDNGNLIIGTSGKGIDFSITSHPAGMTSELLADYEEGTFTPTVSGSSTAGTGTYTARNGKYTKIGNTVYFLIDYILSAHTGTGDTLISGLPYAAGAAYYPDIVTTAGGLSLTALYYIGGSAIGPGGTLIYFQQMPVGGGSAIGIPIDGTSDVRLSGFYFTS